MFGAASRVTLQLPRRRRRDALGAGMVGLTSLAVAAGCGAGGTSTSPAAGGSPAAPTPVAGASGATAPAGTAAPRGPAQAASLRLSWIKNTEFAGFFAAQDRGY